jgi:hypothetical protein
MVSLVMVTLLNYFFFGIIIIYWHGLV